MTTEFDQYAATYDEHLNKALSVSGEDKNFFAQGRLAWLAARFRDLSFAPEAVLDYGCGTGSATPFLRSELGTATIVGVDVSRDSLTVAREVHGGDGVAFCHQSELAPTGEFDLAFCNGVFHHIPVSERRGAVEYVRRSLRPGGYFAFWENNGWHPGTRYCMWRNPFDADAIPLGPLSARRLLARGGFELLRTDFLFVFPRLLAALRFMEPSMCKLPLGAQFLLLGRKPPSPPESPSLPGQ